MKKLVVIVTVLVLMLAIVSIGSAQDDVNGSGWWSSANVQRIGSASGAAEVIMTAYAKQGDTGGPWDCGSRTLDAFGAGATFFPHWDADPAGSNCANDAAFPANYEGAAILSASDQIAAIVQTLNISYGGWAPGDTPYGRALAAYAGVSAPDMSVRFPLYKNEHVSEMTTFYIQNAGDGDTNITATFMPCADDGTGTPCLGYADGPYTYDYSNLEPGKMIVIDATLAENAASATIPTGTGSYGSLVVESSAENIAGAVMEHHMDASPATYLKAVAGFSPAQYDDKYYVPQVKAEYPVDAASSACQAKWSSVMVQNATAASVNVTVTYTINENLIDPGRVGTSFSDNAVIAVGETAFFMTFQQADFDPGDLASATVDASGDVVVMVNEETHWNCTNADLRDLASWSAIADSAGSTSISVPFYKQEWVGKFQGLVVQNVGGSADTFELTMTVINSGITGVDAGDVYVFTHSDTVAGGAAKTFVMPCMDVPTNLVAVTGDYHDLCNDLNTPTAGTNVAVVVESAGGAPIVGVVTEEKGWWVSAGNVGDGHSEDAGMYTAVSLD
jgi:hypothetical protein